MTKNEAAVKIADKINEVLKNNDVQICVYNASRVVKKGCKVVAKGNSIYINGKGGAFLVGSFKVYVLN